MLDSEGPRSAFKKLWGVLSSSEKLRRHCRGNCNLCLVSIGLQTGMPALMFLFLVFIVESICIVETWGAFAGANR